MYIRNATNQEGKGPAIDLVLPSARRLAPGASLKAQDWNVLESADVIKAWQRAGAIEVSDTPFDDDDAGDTIGDDGMNGRHREGHAVITGADTIDNNGGQQADTVDHAANPDADSSNGDTIGNGDDTNGADTVSGDTLSGSGDTIHGQAFDSVAGSSGDTVGASTVGDNGADKPETDAEKRKRLSEMSKGELSGLIEKNGGTVKASDNKDDLVAKAMAY